MTVPDLFWTFVVAFLGSYLGGIVGARVEADRRKRLDNSPSALHFYYTEQAKATMRATETQQAAAADKDVGR